MISKLAGLVERYGQFEQQVSQWTRQWCGPFCSVCRTVCCRPDFCIETRQSAFLERVARRFSPLAVFSRSSGWLSAAGCALVAGRPPVCYEFLCRTISDTVAGDPGRQHALLVASMAITHVGRQAFGRRHLVEATDAAGLRRIHPERVMSRIDMAEAAFHAAVDILEGRSTSSAIQALSRIASPPQTIAPQKRRIL